MNLDTRWEGARTILAGQITDIGMGGCFVLADDKVSVGELIRLEIRQPEEEPVFLWAEVIYKMTEIGFGVRFTGADEAEMERLEWLVKSEVHRAKRERTTSPRRAPKFPKGRPE